VRGWLEDLGAAQLLVWTEPSGVAAWCRVGGVEVEPAAKRGIQARLTLL
jgi:hypothetical protein